MKAVNIGILGLGTVATGTVNALQRNAREITRRAGREMTIQQIAVRDLNKKRDCNLEGISVHTDPMAIVNDPNIDIVVELIGGEEPAKELILQAIKNGKHIVTANKALIAHHGNEIFEAANQKGLIVAFEAAVAGGIPIIKAVREGLAGNNIKSVLGIINGTCNYILSAMQMQGKSFMDALALAQEKGYAEADPSFDIEGVDVAHKLTILASIAFGVPLQFEKVYIEGINGITRQDIRYAEQLGYHLKHLGIAKRREDGIELRVHPTFVPNQHTLAHVNGVMNALLVEADPVGSTLYYGAGAGADPTASSIVADLVDVVRTLTADPDNRVPHLAFQASALDDLRILPMDEIETSYYLKISAEDKPGVLADITRILGEHDISIESILQKERELHDGIVPIVILTQQTREKNMNKAMKDIEKLSAIDGKITRFRLERLLEG